MRIPALILILSVSLLRAELNLVANGSFEFAAEGLPTGWTWSPGQAKGTVELRTDGGVDGRQYLRFTNPSARQANCFSRLATTVSVKPDTDYTLSAYLRGTPGEGFLGGGPGWKVRLALPQSPGGWKRFGGSFQTGPEQTRFELMILTESPTTGFDVDAVQLEEGRAMSDFASGLKPGELLADRISAEESGFGVNLIPNPSFETVDGIRPKHWAWDSRNTKSTCTVVPDTHSGDNAIRITNETAHGPHIYGQLALQGGLRLEPGVTYTLSAYVKSDDPGVAWLGGGDGWWMRIGLRSTKDQWRRFTRTFEARPGDVSFPLMINTDSPTKGFLVDDLKLEKGLAATEFDAGEFAKTPVHVQLSVTDAVSCDGFRAEFGCIVNLRPESGERTFKATVAAVGGEYRQEVALPEPLAAGTHHVRLVWAPPGGEVARYELAVTVGDSVVRREFELFTPARFETERRGAEQARVALETALADAAQAGIVCPYAKAARVIAKRFLPLASVKLEKGVVSEAVGDAQFLRQLCAEQTTAVQAALRHERGPFAIPDPDLNSLRLHDGNFWAGDEPVMLLGGMGYGELKDALDDYRDYGFNVLGDDFTNGFTCFRNLRPDETFDPASVPKLRAAWQDLARRNLAVASIPTLHYFPEWALAKYPDITGGTPVDCLPDWSGLNRTKGKRTKQYGAFFPFAIDSPSLRQLVSAYYGGLFPGLRGVGGFQVVWLMNEPTYTKVGDAHYLGLYHEFLRQRYGTVSALNEAWGTQLADFSEAGGKPAAGAPSANDWYAFHQDQVASWFEWLGAEAKRQNPDLILSNKPMAWTLLHPEQGIDFEREAELWEIPGCDAGRSPGSSLYAFGWQDPILLFDFQKSVAPDKPLGDHEYHYVHEAGVSAEYVRATYFQSYLRGLRMSQFWVWATGLIGEGTVGAGMSHTAWQQPRVAWGTATSALDLRRLAHYVAPFPGKAQVAIYFSQPSLRVDRTTAAGGISRVHAEANFLDTPIGFATDRMILAGKLARYRLLIVPDAEYVEPAVRAAIADFARQGGHVLATPKSLRLRPTGQAYAEPFVGANIGVTDVLGRSALAAAVERGGVVPPVRLAADAGHHVECRSATVDGKTVFYLLALGKEPETVEVKVNGTPLAAWTDLLSGSAGQGASFTLAPLACRLLRVE